MVASISSLLVWFPFLVFHRGYIIRRGLFFVDTPLLSASYYVNSAGEHYRNTVTKMKASLEGMCDRGRPWGSLF